jgi:hypothetical protein
MPQMIDFIKIRKGSQRTSASTVAFVGLHLSTLGVTISQVLMQLQEDLNCIPTTLGWWCCKFWKCQIDVFPSISIEWLRCIHQTLQLMCKWSREGHIEAQDSSLQCVRNHEIEPAVRAAMSNCVNQVSIHDQIENPLSLNHQMYSPHSLQFFKRDHKLMGSTKSYLVPHGDHS